MKSVRVRSLSISSKSAVGRAKSKGWLIQITPGQGRHNRSVQAHMPEMPAFLGKHADGWIIQHLSKISVAEIPGHNL